MNQGPIHLHIEELVLHGFEPRDRHGIADAVERELHTLLAAHGVPAGWHSGPDSLKAGTIATHAGSGPATTGAQIARAVHGGATR